MVSKVLCVACALFTAALLLTGCGGGGEPTTTVTTTTATTVTTSTTTTTTAQTVGWTLLEGKDCVEKDGAMSCHANDDETAGLDLEACKQKCIDYEHCEGFSMLRDNNVGCWLKYDVRPYYCKEADNVNIYVYNPRVKALTTTTTTTKSSSDDEVVKQMNEQYNNGTVHPDSGVFLHGTDFDSGLVAQFTMISFSLVNPISWQLPDGPINIYAGGVDGLTIIGTPDVKDIAVCYYPCDGASDHRSHRGCGIPGDGADTCSDTPDQSAWCSDNDDELQSYGSGSPCAFQPDRAQHAMELFKKHKKGEPWKLRDTACKSPSVPVTKAQVNEVVLDGEKWNHGVKDYVWAYVITDVCKTTQKCLAESMQQYKDFTGQHGHRPLLFMDRCNLKEPFSIYKDSSASIRGDGKCPPQLPPQGPGEVTLQV